jgi:HK97 family phage prohead protease
VKFELKRISETEFEGVKTFEFSDLKVDQSADGLFIEGYVNTKNKPDAYGDIPTNYNGQPVYDLTRYKKNPVLLVDHNNSAGYVAGKAVEISEDEKGLMARFKLMDNPVNPLVQHAVNAVKEGLLIGTSIGGRWYYENPQDKAHLTKAAIAEISLVAVGADPRALVKPSKKSIDNKGDKSEQVESLASMIGQFRVTGDLKVLGEIKEALTTKH